MAITTNSSTNVKPEGPVKRERSVARASLGGRDADLSCVDMGDFSPFSGNACLAMCDS